MADDEEYTREGGTAGGTNYGPLAVRLYKLIGKDGVDWIHRHFMTSNYRNMVQSRQNAFIRDLVKAYQVRSRIRTHIKKRINMAHPGMYKRSSMTPLLPTVKKRYTGTTKPIWVNGYAKTTAKPNIDVARRFKTNQLLYTWYTYNMHPVVWCDSQQGHVRHIANEGVGPALYWQTDEALVNSTSTAPNPRLGMLRPGTSTASTVDIFPAFGVVYVFAADWLGATMNPDTTTQGTTTGPTTRQRLRWEQFTYGNTTDANSPIVISDILGTTNPNRDWSCIRHYSTTISFDFTNLCPYKYTVEILFFKWLVDPHDMAYEDMCLAPMSNQTDMQQYCDTGTKSFGTQQITVLKRKRIYLRGIDNPMTLANNALTGVAADNYPIATGSHTATYVYKVRRKYNIMRPVKQGDVQEATTEDVFFNRYYIAEQGVYCRVQAWPTEPLWNIPGNGTTAVAYPKINNAFDVTSQPDNTVNLAQCRPSVQCIMHKKSYFKFDQPILKGPFRDPN